MESSTSRLSLFRSPPSIVDDIVKQARTSRAVKMLQSLISALYTDDALTPESLDRIAKSINNREVILTDKESKVKAAFINAVNTVKPVFGEAVTRNALRQLMSKNIITDYEPEFSSSPAQASNFLK